MLKTTTVNSYFGLDFLSLKCSSNDGSSMTLKKKSTAAYKNPEFRTFLSITLFVLQVKFELA